MTGLCECGCGTPTPIAARNYLSRGQTQGQPLRYVHGHNGRGKARPRVAETRSYRETFKKRVHRIRAENALGGSLPPGAVVHHADGSVSDNAPLVICQDQAYHRLLHARMRVVKAGGNPNTQRICCRCGELRPTASFTANMTACRACRNVQYRASSGATTQRRKRCPQ